MTESEKAQLVVREIVRQSIGLLEAGPGSDMTMVVMLVTPTGGVAANYMGKPLQVLGLLDLMGPDMRETLRAAMGSKQATLRKMPGRDEPDLGAFGVQRMG